MTQAPEPGTFTHRSLTPLIAAPEPPSNEKFPSFDETHSNAQLNQSAVADSPLEISPGTLPDHESRWTVRSMSQRLRDSRPSGVFTHRPRRSVSDAIQKLRTRQGSMGENAHELAQALKAPLSWRLIVSDTFTRIPQTSLIWSRLSVSPGT